MISNFKLNIEEGLEGIKSNAKNNINILSKFINSKTRIIFLGSSAQYGFVEKNQQPVKRLQNLVLYQIMVYLKFMKRVFLEGFPINWV